MTIRTTRGCVSFHEHIHVLYIQDSRPGRHVQCVKGAGDVGEGGRGGGLKHVVKNITVNSLLETTSQK